MTTPQYEKAKKFHDLHSRDDCFLMPNAWDIGSAKMLEAAGFAAVATTSAGIAFSLGRPDNGFCSAAARLDRDSMLARIDAIANAISLPLNADLEAGYGDAPEAVSDTFARAIASGAVGGNLEDYTGEKSTPLYDIGLATDRIRAAREAIDRSGIPFVLVGRTDCFLAGHPDAFAESVRRANRFRAAGADCLFVPGVSDADTIAALVKEIDGPLNIVMGLTGNSLTVAELRTLGVRRISIGGSLARAMYHHIRNAAREMIEHGTFSYAERQIPQSELNSFFDGAH
jgi:2-methylisocitrate lyase-like PEP mutase family enzyme